VERLTEDELQRTVVFGKRITFDGIYEEAEYSYILDFSTSGLLVQTASENSICTLFRIDKQGNCLNEIKRYFSGNVEITNPILNNYFLL
jgi:hypothetical protein